jgi:N-acyl homoserine lactone hydrolase
MMGAVEMTILPLGDCICASSVLTPGHRDEEMRPVPVLSYLVTLDDGSTLVIDTGMSRDHIGDPHLTFGGTPADEVILPDMAADDDLVARLAAAGLTPDDVTHVINTHLHFDHAGNNTLFRRAEIIVQREQHEFAQGHESFPNQYWNDPALTYRLVDGREEVLPGVEVIPTPGHVPGHQSVLLQLPETGPVLLSGDAVHVAQSYELDNWDGHMDPAAARESAWMLKKMAEDLGAAFILGHEPAQIAQFPRFPHVFR